MKRAVSVLLMLALSVACRDQQSVTSPGSPRIAGAIFDGSQTNGNPHFFFLPPMVSQPTFSGALNANVAPVVQICTLNGAACNPGITPINPGTVQLDGDHYLVNWNTGATDVSTSLMYRIQVFAAGELLGFADVQPVTNGSQLKNLKTGDIIGLVDGRTLPIKFRIENGALCFTQADCGEGVVGPAGGTVVTTLQGAGAFFPVGALTRTVTVVITQNSSEPCLPFDLVQRSGCYTFRTDPGPNQFQALVTAGICVETAGLSRAELDLLHLHKFDPGQPVEPLVNVSAAFLSCNSEGTIGAAGSGGGGLFALAKARLKSLTRYLMPRPLQAAHVGVGGLTGSFSTIGWALPAEMFKSSGDGQTAVSGTAVPVPPSVLLQDSSEAPIAGETVTFSVGSGGGSVTGATQVTNASGIATVGSWTLGSGVNTLLATSVGAVGSPQTFTATGVAIAATVADPTGDAATDSRVATSPDLVSATATAAQGNLTLSVRFAPGTFNSQTGLIEVLLDTDRNPATGSPGSDAGGVSDAGVIGVDYLVLMTSAAQADVRQYAGTPNSFTHIGSATVAFVADGVDVTIPLSLLGNDDGQMNFKVTTASQVSPSGFSGVLDYMPNVGSDPGMLQLPAAPIP